MKRKSLITSILVIVLCLALISGSTYSLFTSESSVNIAVTSGKVDVSADVTDLKVYSATADTNAQLITNDLAGEIQTGPFAGKYYYQGPFTSNTFANGGTATWATDTKVLTIEKITPGDKVTLNVSVTNNSNVKAKYRVRVNALESINAVESLKLFEGLAVSVGGTALEGVIRVSPWTQLDVNAVIPPIPVEIVLPLEAGNEYQNLKTEIQITVEAVQDNAATNAEIKMINEYLASQTPKNNTMYDAIVDAQTALNLASYAEAYAKVENYLWNVDTDQFYTEEEVEGFAYKYFKVYKEKPTTQTYSIYAGSEWTATTVPGLTVGFDAGVTSGITSITYDRSAATYGQEVVIRTNSAQTAIEINAPKDLVHHYGVAGSVDIIAVAGQSYHEFGKVGFIQIAKGRVALEKDSSVNQIHFDYNETAQKFDEIVVAVDSTVTLPKLSRDVVENIGANGTLVVELQDNTNAEQANSDYIWLYQQGLVEQIRISDSNESAGNVKATAYEETTNTYKAADDIANNLREGLSYDYLKEEDGSVPTQDSYGATIQNGGKTEQQKGEDRQAAITDVTQKVCLHVNKNYVSDGSTGHHAVCQDCGKEFATENHTYDAEHADTCLFCEYVDNEILINVVADSTALTESTVHLSDGITAYNESTASNTNFVIELEPGNYNIPVSTYWIDQTKLNSGNTLTIRAKNMKTAISNWDVRLIPTGVTNTGNLYYFAINGCSDYSNGGAIRFEGLYFDMSDTAYADSNYGNARLFAVYCGYGTESRYAHNITIDKCKFDGCGGKFASAVGANTSNSSPSAITISNCIGDKLNCWFNGYLADNSGFGLALTNLTSTNFLCALNNQSSAPTITLNNVDGSFLYDASGDGYSTEFAVVYTKGGTISMVDCNISILSNPKNGTNAPAFINDNGKGLAGNLTIVVDNTNTFPSVSMHDVYISNFSSKTVTINGVETTNNANSFTN